MTTSPSKSNWKEQITNDFRNVIYVKEERNKFITASMEAIIFVAVLIAWFTYGFLPIMQHVETYEKKANWDPVLALSGIGGSLLPLVIPVYRHLSIFLSLIYLNIVQVEDQA